MLSSKAPSVCSRMSALSAPRRAGRAVGARAEPDEAKAPVPVTPSETPAAEPVVTEPVAVLDVEPKAATPEEPAEAEEVTSDMFFQPQADMPPALHNVEPGLRTSMAVCAIVGSL